MSRGFSLNILNNLPQIFAMILKIKFLNFFFLIFTQSLDKVTVEIWPNFYYGLFKNFLASFRRLLIVSNFICLNFIFGFIKLFIKIPVCLKLVPKFQNFYLKFYQTQSKIYAEIPTNFLYHFSICFFPSFEKIFWKIYSKF